MGEDGVLMRSCSELFRDPCTSTSFFPPTIIAFTRQLNPLIAFVTLSDLLDKPCRGHKASSLLHPLPVHRTTSTSNLTTSLEKERQQPVLLIRAGPTPLSLSYTSTDFFPLEVPER